MKESEKMLEIIHANCRKEQEKLRAREEKKARKEKNHRRIELICLVSAFIAVLFLGYLYNEHSVKGCIEKGGSENFCRYAGE